MRTACKYFMTAANKGQSKAFYQLAKMFHTGIAVKKNIPMVSEKVPQNYELSFIHLSYWCLILYLVS